MEIVSDRFSDCQRPPRQPKITTKSVRECLQPESLSEFQARMTQIRSILVLKNSDREWSVGKSRPKFANLPSHLVDSDFGYRARDPNNVDNTIHGEYEHDANYEAEKQPGYQLTRRYESPFDRCQTFGRSLRLDPRSSRIQRLFQNQSGECECEADRKTDDDRLKLLTDGGSEDIFDRIVAQSSSNNIYEVFHGAPVQRDLTDVKNALAHVNSLRLVIKKRDSDLIFLELMDHYHCVDKDKRKVVDSVEFYRALATVNIKPNPKMFNLLLKIFDWIEGNDIRYEKALDLLNWKYVFPSFEKLRLVHPVEERNYTTTYQDTMTYS